MKKILVNQESWETRVAIIRNNRLQNVYLSSNTSKYLERSFFKGVVTKVLPGIQTAFVDIGQEKAGFLHISEMDFSLALSRMDDNLEIDEESSEKENTAPKKRMQNTMDMGKILTEGETILVTTFEFLFTSSIVPQERFCVLLPLSTTGIESFPFHTYPEKDLWSCAANTISIPFTFAATYFEGSSN